MSVLAAMFSFFAGLFGQADDGDTFGGGFTGILILILVILAVIAVLIWIIRALR